jgi:predicted flap endonuclease-1-like 5' DNA nuclease
MAQKNDQQQEALRGLYDLQQQFLDNMKQMLQPQAVKNPFDQMFNPWAGMSGAGFTPGQNPFAAWMPPSAGVFGGAGFDDFYRQMQQQLLQAFGQNSGQPMNAWTDALRATGATGFNPADALSGLYSAEQQAKASELFESLQQYQRVSVEIAQLTAKLAQDSIEHLQAEFKSDQAMDLEKLPQRWTEISRKVLQQATNSDEYATLRERYNEVQQQVIDDAEDYRKSMAEALGLVTQERFDALREQLETLSQQVEKLSTLAVYAVTGMAEDFTVLDGVNREINDQLHQQGIRNLDQLASMSDDMLRNLDQDLQAKGKVIQQQWREQAEQFLNAMTGKNEKK